MSNDIRGSRSTLREMVRLSAEESNELFDTLSDWEHQLRALGEDNGSEIEEPTP